MGDLEHLCSQEIISEILTLDKTSNLLIENIVQYQANSNFPAKSIGKIYKEDKSVATGYIVGFNSEGPLLLTCKHTQYDPFYNNHRDCLVCFNQYSSVPSPTTHVCGKFYVILGRSVSVIGFMGKIMSSTSPLKDLIQNDINYLQSVIVLTKSSGEIFESKDLAGITCPATAGFSGSPVVVDINGNFYAWEVFSGGPALEGHLLLISVAKMFLHDKIAAREIIKTWPIRNNFHSIWLINGLFLYKK